ncbi:alpha/beta hydrolase [Gordonia McavH-238-E]|uniref:alpha/beta fold hydrolase n=1 Tax=Gordonia sp. McavH-238-E TaxID=2917736 RepID=UPI001EF62738|nr:alpha/beta hydrolase [Gordonia sp. McavH-238-E]MCG7632664.1 alpha/beta hydrolase [Gordonia sp. McavH-238-E]
MTQRRLFFVHGAGGYVDDGPLAEALSAALGATLVMPVFSDDDMSIEAWARPVRDHFAGLGADDLVVAHSFGATVLVHVLAEAAVPAPRPAVLLAMPNWGPDGWDVPQYAFTDTDADAPLSEGVALHHCVDDDVVPVEHLDLNTALLPSATVHRHPTGGHQFDGLAELIAADALGARALARGRSAPDPG